MNRIIAWLTATVLCCICLTGCNDDTTESDNALTQQIMGKWHMTYTNDETSEEISYSFENNEFRYSSFATSNDGMKVKGFSIHGSWNIRKGILQLHYDLETLITDGLTAEEGRTLEDSLYRDNLMLEDLNKDGKAYGSVVTFDKQNGVEVMHLSLINGTFTRY